MDNNYLNFLASSSYKMLLQKENTDYNKAFYEENYSNGPHVNIEQLWIDSGYIPTTQPGVNENNEYSITVNGVVLKILKKYENITLTKKSSNTYYNENLKNCILPDFGNGYLFTFKANGETIPFGLNKWVISVEEGLIIFLDGFPEGYSEPLTISFFKYIGRTGKEGFLLTDGSVKMSEGYSPSDDMSVVNKKYVDGIVDTVKNTVDALVPTKPSTFENYNIAMSSDSEIFTAYKITSNEEYTCTFEESNITLSIPKFYYEGSGKISFFINNSIFEELELANLTIGNHGHFIIEAIEDSYKDDIVANGFYTSIKMSIRFNETEITDLKPRSNPIGQFKISYFNSNNILKYSSNSLIIGFEPVIATGIECINNISISESTNNRRYISGVESYSTDSKLLISVDLNNLNYFKNQKIGKIIIDSLGERDIESKSTYSLNNPTHNEKFYFSIPNNIYKTSLSFTFIAYDILGNELKSINYSYTCYIDTVSDETSRLTSGIEEYPTTGYGNFFISSQSLLDNKELQEVDGVIKYPSGIYSNVNYSTITGSRYFIIKVDLDKYINGFYWSFINGNNIINDDVTQKYTNISSILMKIEGKTGWLDCQSPYPGVLFPQDNGDPCLVVNKSTSLKKYCTFAQKNYKGTLFLRIEIPSKSIITFSGIEISY